MARSYRRTFIETAGGLKNVVTHKVFCGWDFSIATGEAAALKSKSIYNELKVRVQLSLISPLPHFCFLSSSFSPAFFVVFFSVLLFPLSPHLLLLLPFPTSSNLIITDNLVQLCTSVTIGTFTKQPANKHFSHSCTFPSL